MLIPFLEETEDIIQGASSIAREFELDFKTGQMTGNIVTGQEALKVWIYNALKTTRYVYDIYSWDYGQDLDDLIGQGYDKGYVDSEVERIITDTLLMHPMIKRCYAFTIEFKNSSLVADFIVDTEFGEVKMSV